MRLASACLLITSVSALLVGCALAPTKSVLEQQKAVAVYSWEAQGQMVFRCTYDERGFFWAFLYPQGKLLDDKGREQAVLGSDFSVTARDGSLVKGHIIEQGPQESARNLRTAVIAVESTNHGLLSGVRYYARRQPEGGMPLASCSASQRGHLLRVRFVPATFSIGDILSWTQSRQLLSGIPSRNLLKLVLLTASVISDRSC